MYKADQHETFMHRCLQLAKLGAGYVAPNPLVGAVLVHEGRIIGEGWHRQYGGPHAEVNCLETVNPEDKPLILESTMYVSLEPCAHFGQTPPCASRIVAEGIRKVVVGITDPFEKVAGRGISLLQEAGIEVTVGVLRSECRWQNRRFITFHEKARPYIHLKWAETADGFIAGQGSERLKISGPLTNRLVHKWRSEEAAIMVGYGTAFADNPQLNNRLWYGAQPLRVVVDQNLALPGSLTMLSDNSTTVVLNNIKEAVEGAVIYKKVLDWSKRDVKPLLDVLYTMQVQSILVEGGAAMLHSFLKAGIWDEAHTIKHKTLMAGNGLRAPVAPSGRVVQVLESTGDFITHYVNN